MLRLTKLFSAFFGILLLASISSCGETVAPTGSSDISNSIPSDATGVLLLNTKQLMEKADFENLKNTDFFKDWISQLEKEDPELVPFLKDPAAAGVNVEGNMGLYFAVPESGETEFAFLLPVADKAKMDAAVAIALKKAPNAKTEDKGDYSLTSIENDVFFVQTNTLFSITSFSDDAKIKALIKPSGNSIKSNDSFAKHQQENKDIMFWMVADPIVKSYLQNPMLAMMIKGGLATAQIPESALSDNYLSLFYDFQNGEMNGGMAFDFSPVLKEELGEMFPDKLSQDYSKYLPKENLAAAVALGVNSPSILNFVSKRGMDAAIDKYLDIVQLDLGQINEGITGDLAMGVYAPEAAGAEPTIVLALGLKDKKFMENLIAKAGPMVQKQGDKYVMSGAPNMMDPSAPPMQLTAMVQDDVVIISNSPTQLEKALGGNSNDIVSELQNGWAGMYLDYELIEKNQDNLMNYLPVDPNDLAMSKMMNQYNEMSNASILLKGDKLDSKIKLKSSDMNALKKLIEVADRMFKDRDKIKAEMEKNMEDEFEGFEDEFEDDSGENT